MRRIQIVFRTGVSAMLVVSSLVIGSPLPVAADTTSAPSLVISQLKITSSNGQFITLYNATDTALDMSKYQLEYFNSYDLAKATSSKLIALSGTVPPHSYFMVNDGSLLLCYQLTIDSVSLGLSATAGIVELLAFNQTSPGSSVTPILQDYVGWSKTVAPGAQSLPSTTNAFLERQPLDAQNNPSVGQPGSGSWQPVQPDALHVCDLVTATASVPTSVASGLNQLLPPNEPPATIVSLANAEVAPSQPMPTLPASDIGLMGPQITEILPNPTGTGTDAADEFIEVYNPNPVTFDLSGFGLQAGTTTVHSFVFPAGTSLPALSFTPYYAAATGLSLSNSGGQVNLLDPFNNSISRTEAYGPAVDGQSWALAKGSWYWTTSPTPGASNTIKQPVATKQATAKVSSASSKTSASGVKGAATTKTAKTAAVAAKSPASASVPRTPIHAWTLALVAGLALLYGAYEYRTDLANRLYQLRRYLGARVKRRV